MPFQFSSLLLALLIKYKAVSLEKLGAPTLQCTSCCTDMPFREFFISHCGQVQTLLSSDTSDQLSQPKSQYQPAYCAQCRNLFTLSTISFIISALGIFVSRVLTMEILNEIGKRECCVISISRCARLLVIQKFIFHEE